MNSVSMTLDELRTLARAKLRLVGLAPDDRNDRQKPRRTLQAADG